MQLRFSNTGFLLSATGAATLVMAQAATAIAADAEHGHQLAKQWCTSCHVIDKAGSGTMIDTAPSFPSIAADPQRSDEKRLTAWLSTSHPTMPNFSLARDTIADLVAYIRSLGPR
jgi:mono/diheme cytochrome c family protein